MIRILHVNGPLWGIESSSYSKVLNEEARKTPGIRFEKETHTYVGYADAVHITAKRAHQKGLIIHGSIEPTPPTGLLVASKKLRDYQKKGVDFLVAKATEGCLLADELALGKSMQAATAARAFRQRCAIICPSFGRGVWLDPQEGELKKWWPAARAVGLSGIKAKPIAADVDVAVAHYDILYAWVDALIQWGVRTLIIDEGQFLMGETSRRTKAAARLAKNCTHRMMLTGTPIEGRTRDLWSPMEVLCPNRFGAFFKFAIRYCDAHPEQIEMREEGIKVQRKIWKFDGSSHLEELRERLTYSPATPWGCMLRRLKSEVHLELPPRQRQIVTLEVDRRFIAPIRAIRSDAILRQSLDLAADGKFPQVIDAAVAHLQAGHKVVVGSYRKHIAELIADGIRQKIDRKVAVAHGGHSLPQRQAIIKSKPDCLCVTIDSTKASINLSHANVGMIAELVWTPSALEQWEGRFGREPGKNVLIQYFVARGTADDLVKRIVLAKLGTSQKAIGKSDSKLLQDLEAKEGAAERMRKLYERIMAQDAA